MSGGGENCVYLDSHVENCIWSKEKCWKASCKERGEIWTPVGQARATSACQRDRILFTEGFCVPVWVFQLPCVHTIGEEGTLCPNNTQHWTDKIDNILLVIYTHILGKGAIRCLLGTHRGVLRSKMKQWGLWEARFVVRRGWGYFLVPAGGCD